MVCSKQDLPEQTLIIHTANTNYSLAMAEMTGLVAATYRKYNTSIAPGFEDKTPAITSRFEVFYDETLPEIAVSQITVNNDTRDTDIFSGPHVHDNV